MTDIRPNVGMKPPSWAGDVVGTNVYEGKLYIACQRGVFILDEWGFEPIPFVDTGDVQRLRKERYAREIGINTSLFPPAPVEKIDA